MSVHLNYLVFEKCISLIKQKLSDDLAQELVSHQFANILRSNAISTVAYLDIINYKTDHLIRVNLSSPRWCTSLIFNCSTQPDNQADKFKMKLKSTLYHIFIRYKRFRALNIDEKLSPLNNGDKQNELMSDIISQIIIDEKYQPHYVERLYLSPRPDSLPNHQLIKSLSPKLRQLELKITLVSNTKYIFNIISACENLRKMSITFYWIIYDRNSLVIAKNNLFQCLKSLANLEWFKVVAEPGLDVFDANWLSEALQESTHLRRIYSTCSLPPSVLCAPSMRPILSRLRAIELFDPSILYTKYIYITEDRDDILSATNETILNRLFYILHHTSATCCLKQSFALIGRQFEQLLIQKLTFWLKQIHATKPIRICFSVRYVRFKESEIKEMLIHWLKLCEHQHASKPITICITLQFSSDSIFDATVATLININQYADFVVTKLLPSGRPTILRRKNVTLKLKLFRFRLRSAFSNGQIRA